MIKFREKDYTIPEGHYTGSKDMDEIPGYVEMAAKGWIAGSVTGAAVGTFMDNRNAKDDAWSGGKVGILGGIAAKLFLDYIHKPMSNIKYNEVDKNIRRQFGIYHVSGVTVGDSLDKRATVEEKFSFNDREVTNYKINFAIHNNQVTMYTFGLTREELNKLSNSLDYYCKKYFSMEYSSTLINLKMNSYSVNITFTNYHVLSEFIMEVSKILNTKINLLDNEAIVLPRLSEAAAGMGEDERSFSVSKISKYDMIKILGTGMTKLIQIPAIGLGASVCHAVQDMLVEGAIQAEKEINGVKTRGDLDNRFLESELKKLHYAEGFHYTTGDESSDINFSLISGNLIISASTEKAEKLDPVLKGLTNRSNTGKVIVYTYSVNKIAELEAVLKKLISTGLKPNLFDKSVKFKMFSANTKGVIEKTLEKIKAKGIVDVEIEDRIPVDVISINGDLSKIRIYIPEEHEWAQYDIEDWVRNEIKFVRTNVGFDRNIMVMKVNGGITQAQYQKLVEYIAKTYGFCSMITL